MNRVPGNARTTGPSGEDTRPGTPATCTACGTPIRWHVTEGDHRIAVNDTAPDPDGTVVVATRPDGTIRARILDGRQLPAQGDAWVDHRRTCTTSKHANRRRNATRPRCPYCRDPMSEWLAKQGLRGHVLCLTDVEHAAWFRGWLNRRSAA